jgi:hypothetical protein
MASCKTTEKNYREAYDRTISANDSTRLDFDDTIYGAHRRAVRDVAMRADGDTVITKVQRVAMTTESVQGREIVMSRYNVVVGEFKQLFNARSMCERLINLGYPGAFVVNNAEPYYYVVIGTYDKLSDAVKAQNAVIQKPPFSFKEGLPYILQAAQLIS